jgi:hypothetical protein
LHRSNPENFPGGKSPEREIFGTLLIMSTDALEIDLSRSPVYEAGAILVTLLALPDGDETQRGNLHASLCYLAILGQAHLKGFGAEQPIKPIYAFRSEDDVAKDLRTLERRLRDRIVAARMAIPFLQAAVMNAPPKLPFGIEKLSLNRLSEIAIRDLNQESDSANVETRIWRPSLPVIHLAVATALAMEAAGQAGEDINIGHLLTNRTLIEWIVTEAEKYAALIEKGGVLPGKASPSLIRVRLRTG